MFDPKAFEEFAQKMNGMMAASPVADIEKNMKAMMAGFFDKLNLVGREEFEVQTALLAAAQQKIGELEARIAKLEAAASA
jgi:BMFP domain-containing protein YqiC